MPSKNLVPDGERMIPEFHKGMLLYGEHLLRYHSVNKLVKNKLVLDIASGSGYGSASMAESAKKVYGVDVSKESVEYARQNFSRKNVEFIEGSGTEIPLEDAAVEVVVSHETIEHIEDYHKFLDEVKRVMVKDGVFVVSTPNDAVYQQDNHFHLHQFTAKELEVELKKYFKHVKFYYQGVWLTSGLLDAKNFTDDFNQVRAVDKWVAQPTNQAVYFVAVCSDRAVNKIDLDEGIAISEPWSERQQREIQKSLDARGGAIKHLEGVIKQQTLEIAALNEKKGVLSRLRKK